MAPQSTGALLREHPGVYRVGHARRASKLGTSPQFGRVGRAPSSVAAWPHLWGILKGGAPPPEVTALTKHRIDGVITRRARSIEATTHRGIPITTVPRTLVDLAGHLTLDALARACHEAGVKHGTAPAQVEAVLRERTRAQGGALRESRREREAHARGDDFRRYTYGDVLEQPRAMLAELETLLRYGRPA